MVERAKTSRRGLPGLIAAALLASACADQSGTMVTMTLTAIEVTDDTYHYELFAEVGGGSVSLQRFEVQLVAGGGGVKEIRPHFDPETVLGVTNFFDRYGRPIGGIRFRVPANLEAASALFITREPDGDTDPTPSANVFAACRLDTVTRGTLTCVLTSPDDKQLIRGTAALVPPSEGIHPL